MKNSEYEKIEFKGSKEGIIIDLNDEKDFDTIANVIVSKIESSKAFFDGAKIYKIESDFLEDDSKNKLIDIITSKFNIKPYKNEDNNFYKKNNSTEKEVIIENKEEAEKDRKESVLKDESIISQLKSNIGKNLILEEKEEKIEEEIKEDNSTKYIPKMRSGDFIESKGNIVIMSDMNSGSKVISGRDVLIMGDMCVGAKVVANGNVIVFGNLFGFVHAGSNGDKNSYIAAKNLRPTILQIANIIAEAPDEYDSLEINSDVSQSEIAFISENQIILETQINKIIRGE